MAKQTIKISELEYDKTLYPRIKINHNTVIKYYGAMRMGNKFPPILVGDYSNKKFIIDGWHRLEAYKKLRKSHIDVIIKKFNTERNVFIEAVKSNSKHGKPYDEQDEKKIILKLKKMSVEPVDISNIISIPKTSVLSIIKATERSDVNFQIRNEIIRERHSNVIDKSIIFENRFQSFYTDIKKINDSKKIITSAERVILLDIVKEINKIIIRK